MPKIPKIPRRVRTFSANPDSVAKALEMQRNRNILYASGLSKRLADKASAHAIAAAAAAEASSIAARRVVQIMESKKSVDPEATAAERAFHDLTFTRLERMEPRAQTVEEQVNMVEKTILKEREKDEIEFVNEDDALRADSDSMYPCENDEGTGFFGYDGQEYFFADLVGHKFYETEGGNDCLCIEYIY